MRLVVVSGVKRKLVGVVALVVIFAVLCSLLVFDRPQDPDLMAYKLQVNQIFRDAKIQFETIRGVSLPSGVTVSVYTKQQAIDRWGKDSSSLVDTAGVLRQENIYKSLFLMAEHESLSGVVADWVASWTAVTVGNEIYVIYENFWPWDTLNAEAILIHELTHVWQHSLFSPNSSDADRAQNALIEGDASYMADYYCSLQNSRHGNNSSSVNGSFARLPALLCFSNQNFVYPAVPDAVRSLNWFPYLQGKTFVSAIVDVYGWDRLNQCYTTPGYIPNSTAQILHPDQYFAGKATASVIAPMPDDEYWTLIPSSYGASSDTYGEYFIYLMLSQWLNSRQAQTASVGWSGDSFTYYEKDHDFLFTWSITWDSIKDASEFNQVFTDMLKLAQANPQNNTLHNNQWLTNDRYLTLDWNPNTTTTLIICSTNQTAINSLFYIQ
jgi:hypothetical protein